MAHPQHGEEFNHTFERSDLNQSSESEGTSRVHEVNGTEAEDAQVLCEDQSADVSDDESIASEDSEMEPFEDYKKKIEQVLTSLDMTNFDIEPIHHGYTFENNVYALTSLEDPAEQYILRVPVVPDFRESDGKCEAIENDAFFLNFIQGKLPVPKVKSFCSTKDNALEAPFGVQSRLPGQCLEDVYDDLDQEGKIAIIEQIVELMAKLESIQFDVAGKFVAPSGDASTATSDSAIKIFSEGDEDFMKGSSVTKDRQGPDLKAFLQSHMNGWIAKELKIEAKEERSFAIQSYREILTIIDALSHEGAFARAPFPVVLHHWDFEPRNIMVEDSTGTWRISGIIDWDDAIAVPRPLARRPLDWIWDSESESYTGYLNTDHQPKPLEKLNAEERELKAKFDALAASKLQNYAEDAYGHGRWLRRIWTFAKEGGDSMWYIELMELLIKDWNERPKPVVRQPPTVWDLIRWAKESLKPWALMKKVRDAFWRLVGTSKV